MSGKREERIRQRAHEIWETEGRPSDKATEHWARATAEVEAEDTPAPKAAEKPRAPKAPKAAPAAEKAAAKPAAEPRAPRAKAAPKAAPKA